MKKPTMLAILAVAAISAHASPRSSGSSGSPPAGPSAGPLGNPSAGSPGNPSADPLGNSPAGSSGNPSTGPLGNSSPGSSGGPTVVLDPGHGGSNPGATGATGLHEKQLSLSLALAVTHRLRAHGITVQLTRTTDRTLTLRQRVAIADGIPADLFVSIHANASPTRTQRGYETYVLTPRGIDIDGRALRSDTTTPRPSIDPDIALVLDDLERGASQWEAADLAARMQRALRDRRGPDGDRGVRQDAQHVLLGATMPAVLVEVGFLDHPLEGRQLADAATQAQLAEAIAEAITDQLAD